jgi:succinoglycan biosynthesis protein ExoA
MSRVVAVVIPTLDEAAHIGALLKQLSRVTPNLLLEIIVADGGSTDATRSIVMDCAAQDQRIKLIENPRRIQSAGLNRAIRSATDVADTIIRIDAHGQYPDDYVERIVDAFIASDATMIATRLHTVGVSVVQRGVAFAMNSRVGTGGSAHRIGSTSGFVDHGHHAGIDRTAFMRAGGYDESFVANEDAELDVRIRRNGGSIWLATDIVVDYLPRASFVGLARQYWRYGVGRCQTFHKHGERLRLRQMLPPVASITLIASTIAIVFDWRAATVPAAYGAILVAWSAALAIRHRDAAALLAAPAAATMHIAWGLGFLKSLAGATALRSPVDRRRAASTSVRPLQEQAE